MIPNYKHLNQKKKLSMKVFEKWWNLLTTQNNIQTEKFLEQNRRQLGKDMEKINVSFVNLTLLSTFPQHIFNDLILYRQWFKTFCPLSAYIATLEVYVCIAFLRDNKSIVWMMYYFTNALGHPHQTALARKWYNPSIHHRGPKKAMIYSVQCPDRWDIWARDNVGMAIWLLQLFICRAWGTPHSHRLVIWARDNICAIMWKCNRSDIVTMAI